MKVGLLGYGKVGRCFVESLHRIQDSSVFAHKIDLHGIGVRQLAKIKEIKVPYNYVSTDLNSIVSDPEIEVIVELIGGVEPTKTLVEKAIKNGKHVVTANRPLIAASGEELLRLSNDHRVTLLFEGAVGCGIPIINYLKLLNVNDIKKIVAIVNGTCNYVLSLMETKKMELDNAIADANVLSIAEPNILDDLEGVDSAEKLIILTLVAFQEQVSFSQVSKKGIANIQQIDFYYANRLNCTIKQLGIISCMNEELNLSVEPCIVHKRHPLATANGIVNSIYLRADPVGFLHFSGKGVSPEATSSAVLCDVLSVINNNNVDLMRYNFQDSIKRKISIKNIEKRRYYIRFFDYDMSNLKNNNLYFEILGKIDKQVIATTNLMHEYEFEELKKKINDRNQDTFISIPICDDDIFPFLRGSTRNV